MDFCLDCIILLEDFDLLSFLFIKCKRFLLCVNFVEGFRISIELYGLLVMGNVIS